MQQTIRDWCAWLLTGTRSPLEPLSRRERHRRAYRLLASSVPSAANTFAGRLRRGVLLPDAPLRYRSPMTPRQRFLVDVEHAPHEGEDEPAVVLRFSDEARPGDDELHLGRGMYHALRGGEGPYRLRVGSESAWRTDPVAARKLWLRMHVYVPPDGSAVIAVAGPGAPLYCLLHSLLDGLVHAPVTEAASHAGLSEPELHSLLEGFSRRITYDLLPAEEEYHCLRVLAEDGVRPLFAAYRDCRAV